MMTMPHSPGSGMPGTPGNAPAYPGNAPVYPGAIPGNPYGDMQSAPQVAAPPSHGLVVASICLGVIGIILCAGGLFFGAYTSFDAHDSFERAMAPLNFILVVAMVYILGGIMNIIGLVLGKAARKRAQDPRHAKACMVGIWLNAAPMILFLVAEILGVLWMMGPSL